MEENTEGGRFHPPGLDGVKHMALTFFMVGLKHLYSEIFKIIVKFIVLFTVVQQILMQLHKTMVKVSK